MKSQQYNFTQMAVAIYDADAKLFALNAAARELLRLTEDDVSSKTALGTECKFIDADGSPLSSEEHPINLAIRDRRPLLDRTLGMRFTNVPRILWIKESENGDIRKLSKLEWKMQCL